MIISKTPLRISFFGGGTDLPEYFIENKGAVISTTINKFIYHTVSYHPSSINSSSIKIVYSKVENANNIDEIKHSPFREILKAMEVKDNIEIHVISDLPSFSGLGGSSAFTVGLINCLSIYKKSKLSKYELTARAHEIERNILAESVGYQDQTAAAYGGINLIEFNNVDDFNVTPINLDEIVLKEFEESLMLFFSGIKRKAQDIESKKISNIKNNIENLNEIKKITYQAYEKLIINNNLESFGKMLNDTWNLKKKLETSVSNNIIDEMYTLAIQAGALGGKLLGAGGGGFMLFYVPKDKQDKVKIALKYFHEVDFSFTKKGSEILQSII